MDDKSVIQFADILKIEGVMAKGYGIICKFPMTDVDLGVKAKGIYAYLCSYAGNGMTAFPGIEKTMYHLGISKDTYYKGMNQLKEQGYITVTKQKSSNGQFSHNIYTIVMNPKKFKEASFEYPSDGGMLHSILSYNSIKAAGYGLIPRIVMYDSRLTITAKVIYAYLASFSGAGNVAFPKKQHIQYHLGIGDSTYKTHMRLLVATNYITVTQRHENGKLGRNDYFLNENPSVILNPEDIKKANRRKTVIAKAPVSKEVEDVSAQRVKNQETVKQEAAHQEAAQQETLNQEAAYQEAEKPEDNSTSSFINSSPNINLSINESQPHWMDGWSREKIIQYIEDEYLPHQRAIDYKLPISNEEIDYIIGIIADFVCSGQQNLKIKGVLHSRIEVIERIIALDVEDYAYIVGRVNKAGGKIKNLRRYYLSCLFSAKEDHEMEIQREIAQDSVSY